MAKRPNILKLATKISLESLTYTGITYSDPEYRILDPIVTDDMEKLPVFRYTGDNHPFVCVIQRGVIYPIFIEANFGDVYNHG